MGVALAREDFRELFRTYEHTAFRLETRDAYYEAYTAKAMAQYLAGEPVDSSFLDQWAADRRVDASLGKQMSRVRVVTEPLNNYARYSLHVSRVNVQAGEDIRYLEREQAHELGVPDEDYWLFDSTQAVVFAFADDGTVAGYELLDDPAEIVRRCKWRDAAWHYATTREEYAAVHGVV